MIDCPVELFHSLTHADNGTYLCHGENKHGTAVALPELIVFDKPEVKLDAVVPVGMDQLFFNWTVNNWNSPITDYFLSVSNILNKLVALGFIHSTFPVSRDRPKCMAVL